MLSRLQSQDASSLQVLARSDFLVRFSSPQLCKLAEINSVLDGNWSNKSSMVLIIYCLL
jgi:hypothetical protein